MGKSFKRFVAGLVIVLIMSMAIESSVFAEEPAIDVSHPFVDVNNRYAYPVNMLYEFGHAKGISAYEFGTYRTITRGDAAVILANFLGRDLEKAPDAGFTDLNPRIEKAVNWLANAGIVSGVTKDKFEPHQPLTRGAMAKLLVLSFNLDFPEIETPFVDATGEFKPYIEALYGAKIILGKTETRFGTQDEIIRGDFANMLFKAFVYGQGGVYPFQVISVDLIDSDTISLHYNNVVHYDFDAEKLADYEAVLVVLSNEESFHLTPKNPILSSDRRTLTFDHEDLSGYEGALYPFKSSREIVFNYK